MGIIHTYTAALMEGIASTTGLSPAAFFTIAALMVVVYKTVSTMFVSPQDFNKPPLAFSAAAPTSSDLLDNVLGPPGDADRKPVQFGDMTEHELGLYNGSDPSKPLLISVRAQIYDVSSSRNFYGRGGAYAMFAGKEISRALALLSFKPQDMNGDLEGLGDDELQVLEDWEDKFIEKYAKVGRLVTRSSSAAAPSPEVEQGRVETQDTETKQKNL